MREQRREMACLYRKGYDVRRIAVVMKVSKRMVWKHLTRALAGA